MVYQPRRTAELIIMALTRIRIRAGVSKTPPARGAVPHSEPAARPVAVPPLPAAEPGDRGRKSGSLKCGASTDSGERLSLIRPDAVGLSIGCGGVGECSPC